MQFQVFFLFSSIIHLGVTVNPSGFSEELFVKPLFGDQIYAHFQFVTKWDINLKEDSVSNSVLFPKALSELIKRNNVQELQLGLTAGLWRYKKWGYPIVNAAAGGEVWAWFYPDTENVDENWLHLTNSLSGIFCASFNFIDKTTSINPKFSLRPFGVFDKQVNTSFLRYSSLPREIACTENLTPWKKLLPCDDKMGLGSLLNAAELQKTHYHSIGLRIRNICRDKNCEDLSLELRQTISLVYDYTILGTRDWSFRNLFGQAIMAVCPLASVSNVYIDYSSNASLPFILSPTPDEYVTSIRGGFETTYAKYYLRPYPISVASIFMGKKQVLLNNPPALYANQYKTGIGQQQGTLVLEIHNNHWGDLDVLTLQNLPWFLPIYMHTLKVVCNGKRMQPKLIKYQPGNLREKPHSLEMMLKAPANSKTVISVDFNYVFLRWQEYPPDANHGFYIGPAIVTALLPLAKNYTGLPQDGSLIQDSFNASRSSYLVQVYTEIIVITLPTPDFSMPYNVICLACTVVALAFGPLHNITTKRLTLVIISSKGKPNLFGMLFLILKSKLKLDVGKKEISETN